MPVSLLTDRPFVSQPYSSKTKNVRFIANSDVKEVKKVCPWAVITVPHVTEDGSEGHMAFKTVSGYSEWMTARKK